MRFLRRQQASPPSSRSSGSAHDQPQRDGTELLERVKAALTPLVAEFNEIAEELGVEDETEVAIDRLFAYSFLILAADEETWRGHAKFTINEAILRRDEQNRALRGIQIEAEPWLRKLQARANNWAEATLGAYLATLPDEWFRFALPTGQATMPGGVKNNCLQGLAYGAVALTSFDFADESHLRALYVPAYPIASLDQVLALAARTDQR